MKNTWYLLYNLIIIPIAKVVIFFISLFNQKVRTGIRDRRKLFENLIIDLTGIDRKKKMIWFHSASMGEFEQAKPIIEKIKSEKKFNIIITFFSPSGYRNSLKYPYADIISYIPIDTPILTERFLNLVRPHLAVFMRYDFWPNMVWQLDRKRIPYFIVDATMRSRSKRKLPLAIDFHRSLFSNISRVLTVSEDDAKNFREFGIPDSRIEVVGDTRFDRVYQKSLDAKEKKLFKEDFFKGKKIFVLGSTWESDEEIVLPALMKAMEYDPDLMPIIVPHEPTVQHLERIEHTFYKHFSTIRFSYLNNYKNERVIIVDSIGILLTLYTYAHAAYVGGSFKQGIHNVLEPAVYGIPVIFGPKIENSREANLLVSIGGAFVIRNKKEAYRIIRRLFTDQNFRSERGKICSYYVKENTGASDKILQKIYNQL
ncbi:MAG TPA: glycosyltransferase N-terminal domain-containing protein [Melioribacteraceae bacterium]|nr:glycosyltransferase N-terminal domain-containing protein [Melioribacteraceae bacterium]